MTNPLRDRAERAKVSVATSDRYPARVLQPHLVSAHPRTNLHRPLHVTKFGGTSVNDAACIAKVADIIKAAARDSDVVVVVSAMRGVTDLLIEAATQSEAGNQHRVSAIFQGLRQRHESAANALIHSADKRQSVARKINELVQQADSLCQEILLQCKLTLRVRDSLSGLGERLSAPLVAAALEERGIGSQAIDATELIVTDSCYGSAEPYMDLTRERCEARLRPLLMQGIVPVVTGFIAATVDGIPTTLGRNSSDYSGTIMGAALNADEVTLWTDVDGILTSDPRLVPSASSILEMSYREASDLADLGAKVLHPKTLRALLQSGIPLSIRNTFAPDRPGTKITPDGSSNGAGVKAATAAGGVALITVRASSVLETPDILRRTLATAAAVPVQVRLLPQSSSSKNAVCIVVSSDHAESTVEALGREFTLDLAREKVKHITLNPSVAIITLVGRNLRDAGDIVGRLTAALDRDTLKLFGLAQPSSGANISFVVAQQDVKAVLATVHRELKLDGPIR
jgi:bifunctional aspartokinase / homoserine dehydrogenase 1